MKRHPTKRSESKPAGGQCVAARENQQPDPGQSGFTIIETTIAMVLMLIVALGAASLFSYSIYNNSGGSDRAVSLAIAQQALETLRSATFTTASTDARLNAGTLVQSGLIREGRSFNLTTIIDDNPTTTAVDVNPTSTLKSITIIVRSEAIVTGWASGAGGTVTLMSLRTRSD